MKSPCRHCRRIRWLKGRGLCWTCWSRDAIWESYPQHVCCYTSQVALRPPTLTPEPTDAVPGSEKKIEVLAARAAAGEHLFHKHDGRTS